MFVSVQNVERYWTNNIQYFRIKAFYIFYIQLLALIGINLETVRELLKTKKLYKKWIG